MKPTSEYVLGHSAAELHRLIEQAAFFGDLTADVFRRAELTPGMSVLDVGCGVGDVAFAFQIHHGVVVGDGDRSKLAAALEAASIDPSRIRRVASPLSTS